MLRTTRSSWPGTRSPHVLALLLLGAAAPECRSDPGRGGVDGGAPVQTTSTGSVSRSLDGDTGQAGSFAAVARAVTPSVVSIESEFAPEVASRAQQDRGEGPPSDLFPPGFLPPGTPQPMPRSRGPVRASGSGFLVSADGYVLTNSHVVADARRVTVGLLDRRIFPATVIGADPSTEVALIKIAGTGLPALTFADDSAVQVGDQVLAVGNPLGLDFTVTSGIVSAKGRSGGLRRLFASDYAVVDFIQTDAVINPGNSGGPLVDMGGRVVGINTAIESPTGVYAGYGFAVPAGIARIVMDQFRRYGRVRRAILGLSPQDVGPADAQAAGLREIRGVLVGGVSGPDSPAGKAGLQPGDVLLAIDGRLVDRTADLQHMLLRFEPGQTVTLTVQRFGTRRTVPVTLGEPPAPPRAAAARVTDSVRAGAAPAPRLGVSVAPLTPEVARELQLPPTVVGVVIGGVDPAGPAAGLLLPGEVVTAVFGSGGVQRPVRSVSDLQQAVAAARGGVVSLLLYTPQARGTRVVSVPLR